MFYLLNCQIIAKCCNAPTIQSITVQIRYKFFTCLDSTIQFGLHSFSWFGRGETSFLYKLKDHINLTFLVRLVYLFYFHGTRTTNLLTTCNDHMVIWTYTTNFIQLFILF